jgi:hypothetical protein
MSPRFSFQLCAKFSYVQSQEALPNSFLLCGVTLHKTLALCPIFLSRGKQMGFRQSESL